MKRKKRRFYSEAQKAEMWDRWQKGESLSSIGRLFETSHSAIQNVFSPTGGIRPTPRRRSCVALSSAEREEISRGIVASLSVRSIAVRLGRAPSTVSREIQRNGGQVEYAHRNRFAQARGDKADAQVELTGTAGTVVQRNYRTAILT